MRKNLCEWLGKELKVFERKNKANTWLMIFLLLLNNVKRRCINRFITEDKPTKADMNVVST